jgi:hypothetical protein
VTLVAARSFDDARVCVTYEVEGGAGIVGGESVRRQVARSVNADGVSGVSKPVGTLVPNTY